MDTNWNHYKTFVQVYEHKNYNQVGRLNNTHPSGIMKTIRSLEKSLGKTLFTTRQNGLIPTTEAHELFDKVNHAVGDIQTAEKYFDELTEETVFTVRIGITPSFSVFHLSALIKKFHSKYKRAQLCFLAMESPEELKTKRIDIAIALQDDFKSSDYTVNNLFVDELTVICKEEIFDKLKNAKSYEDFKFGVSRDMYKLFTEVTDKSFLPVVHVDSPDQAYALVYNRTIDCALYWCSGIFETLFGENYGIGAYSIEQLEGKPIFQKVSCAYIQSELSKGQKEFLKDLIAFCHENRPQSEGDIYY